MCNRAGEHDGSRGTSEYVANMGALYRSFITWGTCVYNTSYSLRILPPETIELTLAALNNM